MSTCCEYCDWIEKTNYLPLEKRIESLKTEILSLSVIVAAGQGDETLAENERAVTSSRALIDMEEELRQMEKQLGESKNPTMGHTDQPDESADAPVSGSIIIT